MKNKGDGESHPPPPPFKNMIKNKALGMIAGALALSSMDNYSGGGPGLSIPGPRTGPGYKGSLSGERQKAARRRSLAAKKERKNQRRFKK